MTEVVSTPAGLDVARRVWMFERMVTIREFEQRVQALFLRNLVGGSTHLSNGQEAVSVGVAAALRPDDYTFATYRGHANAIARGAPLEALMAEIMGKATGINGGKGGSMHLTSVDHGVLGSYAIVGGHLPIACGSAWSSLYRQTEQVTVCFFGDGATNIGAFHEALNLAAVWKLPVVFVCENNLYMEYTAIGSVTAVGHPAADRAGGYGLDRIVIDGNDPDVVVDAAEAAISAARAGRGPALIEACTYRHGGHSRADPGTYRPSDEVAAWLERDPIPAYRQRLLGNGVTEEQLAQIERSAADAVEAATEAAVSAPSPPLESARAQLWADGGAAWRR